MICTIEKHRSMDEGYADALMLDWQGRVAEATGANFFVPGRQAAYADRRLLPGRHHAPDGDRARQQRGIEVIERRIRPEELAGFEQCFLPAPPPR